MDLQFQLNSQFIFEWLVTLMIWDCDLERHNKGIALGSLTRQTLGCEIRWHDAKKGMT